MGNTARETKIGVNIATAGSWSTSAAVATAVGAGDGHYLRDDVDIQLKKNYVYEDSPNQAFIGAVQVSTHEAIAAQLPMWLHYNDVFQNVLWALALGTGGTAPVAIGTSTAYNNTFEPATTRTTLYATILRDKVQDISEVPGAVFTGVELRVADNGRMEVDWAFTGDTEKIDSAINTATQVSALTFPTKGLRAFWKDAVVRINSQSGGALGPSDAVKVTGMKLKFSQPVDVKYVGGQATIIQPLDNGFPDISLELTFARYDATSKAFFNAHRDGSVYKADIILTGPQIGTTTTSYGLKLEFPNLSVPAYTAPLPGTQQGEPTIMLSAMATTTAPTGMTGVTKPLRVTTTGVSTTNPFA